MREPTRADGTTADRRAVRPRVRAVHAAALAGAQRAGASRATLRPPVPPHGGRADSRGVVL